MFQGSKVLACWCRVPMCQCAMAALATTVIVACSVLPALAHDLERTEVTLSFSADGAFVLDIANDPSWLLLRLESFAGPSTRPDSFSPGGVVPVGLTPAARDARLSALGDVFIDRVVLFVDGHEIRPTSAEYEPPPPQKASDPLPPLARFLLRGRVPRTAQTLRWLYGMVIDPYPITIRRADGRAISEWVQGSNWSGVLDLHGQFREPTRMEVMREYLARFYTRILPKGREPIAFVLGLFLLTLGARAVSMRR